MAFRRSYRSPAYQPAPPRGIRTRVTAVSRGSAGFVGFAYAHNHKGLRRSRLGSAFVCFDMPHATDALPGSASLSDPPEKARPP